MSSTRSHSNLACDTLAIVGVRRLISGLRPSRWVRVRILHGQVTTTELLGRRAHALVEYWPSRITIEHIVWPIIAVSYEKVQVYGMPATPDSPPLIEAIFYPLFTGRVRHCLESHGWQEVRTSKFEPAVLDVLKSTFLHEGSVLGDGAIPERSR